MLVNQYEVQAEYATEKGETAIMKARRVFLLELSEGLVLPQLRAFPPRGHPAKGGPSSCTCGQAAANGHWEVCEFLIQATLLVSGAEWLQLLSCSEPNVTAAPVFFPWCPGRRGQR